MGQRVALIVLTCFIMQLTACEAKPSETLTKKVTRKYAEKLNKMEKTLASSPAYLEIKSFIEKPHCEIDQMNRNETKQDGLILEALMMAARMNVQGCANRALKAMLILVDALVPYDDVSPVCVTDTSACSREADEGIRMLLSEISVLREMYAFLAGGLYSAAGCMELSAAHTKSVVDIGYKMFNKEKTFDNYETLESDEEVLHVCAQQLEELSNDIKQQTQVEEEERRRKRQEECERSWERSIYKSLKDIPFLGAVWEIGSAIGYAIAGCSGVAAQRGKDGASNVAQILTMYFASS